MSASWMDVNGRGLRWEMGGLGKVHCGEITRSQYMCQLQITLRPAVLVKSLKSLPMWMDSDEKWLREVPARKIIMSVSIILYPRPYN